MTSSGKNGLNIRTNASPKWDYIGGSRGRVDGVATPSPFGRKIYQKLSIFAIFRAATPFPDRLVDKSSHKRLHPPPFQKI